MNNIEKFMLLLLCFTILGGCKEDNLYSPPEKEEKRDVEDLVDDMFLYHPK